MTPLRQHMIAAQKLVSSAVAAVDHIAQSRVQCGRIIKAFRALFGRLEQLGIQSRNMRNDRRPKHTRSERASEVDIGPQIRSAAEQQRDEPPWILDPVEFEIGGFGDVYSSAWLRGALPDGSQSFCSSPVQNERRCTTSPVSSLTFRIDERPFNPVPSYRKPSRYCRPCVKAVGSCG